MKDKNRDLLRLQHILDAIYDIQSFLSDKNEDLFSQDTLLQSACIRQLEIIGEAANSISDELKSVNIDIEWRDIVGLRNILIHEYFGIDLTIIWQIIVNDLPPLKIKISQIIKLMK